MARVPFHDRAEAGRVLAELMRPYAGREDVMVLALPRGGVPVAFEVARALGAPLDLIAVRKLGVPGHEELAMGAIAVGGARVLNDEVISHLHIGRSTLDRITEQQRVEVERLEHAYRGDRPRPALRDRCVILVDDGLATGATMAAAVEAALRELPRRVVVAVPVAPPDTCERLSGRANEVIAVAKPELFGGVGQWYLNFEQTTDDEVRDLLDRAGHSGDQQTRRSA
ncbi:MAG: phosphoribosyltransferase family protein [Phycisphaeraceae bacterium]